MGKYAFMQRNPFLETLVVPYVRVIRRDTPINKTELDEGDYYEFEAQDATRVYRNANTYKVVGQLTAAGTRLLMWMMYNISDDAVTVKLNEQGLSELFEISSRQIARMKAELISAAIIAKKEYNEYWINPKYFASGNRMKLYPGNTLLVATRREKW